MRNKITKSYRFTAAKIINGCKRIYDRFEIPPNLREHMVRVASLAALICDNWIGPRIEKNEVIAAALVHDLGNIVKFNSAWEMENFGEKAAAEGGWRRIKERMVRKYGSSDDHIVTNRMLEELGAPARIRKIVREYYATSTVESGDFSMKILLYSDARVNPSGVVSLKERFAYFKKQWSATPRMEYYKSLWKPLQGLEKELAANMRIDPRGITEATIKPYMEKYSCF